MTDRKMRWGQIDAQIKTWGIPGVLEVNGPQDQALLQEFLDRNELLKQALAERIRDIESARQTSSEAAPPPQSTSVPLRPLTMSQAVNQFETSMQASSENTARTRRDKRALLAALREHVARTDPSLGKDPFVHEIRTPHLSTFLDSVSLPDAPDGAQAAEGRAPKTLLKKISDLRSFFAYAKSEIHATALDPTVELEARRKRLRAASVKQERHYEPFQEPHLKRIFEPTTYLAFNRAADYFWAPLLGLHLGTRLKEVVTLRVEAVGQHRPTGIWYLDIRPEDAKNANSIRRLPIPERLLEVGFIDYVEHVRQLGAEQLFPHRDLSSATSRADPSKNCSRHFAKYLDSLELSHPGLVFHSFRHTVVTALQDAGTPISDSMQIVGHQAQDLAIRSGHLTSKQARSVHLDNYSHADKPRLGVEHALERLRGHLDRISVPIDYKRLAQAAVIVRAHTRRIPGGGFESGWSRLSSDHAKRLAI